MYMNISDSLDQYADICRDAIKKSSAKLNKSFKIYSLRYSYYI